MFNLLLGLVMSVSLTYKVEGVTAKNIENVIKPVVVEVNGYINEDSSNKFKVDMEAADQIGQSIIPVVLSSYGGSVYALLEMIDIVSNTKTPVAMIATGKCMSACLILLSCAPVRYATKNTTLMLHEISTGSEGKLSEVITDTKEADRLNKLIFTILAKNVGQKSNYFLNLISAVGHINIFMTPKDALEHKIITHIDNPNLVVDVKVKMTLE